MKNIAISFSSLGNRHLKIVFDKDEVQKILDGVFFHPYVRRSLTSVQTIVQTVVLTRFVQQNLTMRVTD